MWLTRSPKAKKEAGTSQLKSKSVPVNMAASESSDSDDIEGLLMGNIDDRRVSDVSMSSVQMRQLLDSIPTPDHDSKNVSFNLPNGHDSDSIFADNDSEKSHNELILKVSKLTDRAKAAEISLSFERTMRKKKERSLLKLAKELKKRNLQKDSDDARLEMAVKKVNDLQQELELVKKEGEQQKVINARYIEDLKTNHERMLKEVNEKYARTCAEHDARITDLSKSHASQCESLCREILKANLEADRLQNELDPTKKRTSVPFSEPKRVGRMDTLGKIIIVMLVLVSGSFFAWERFGLRSSVCSPVIPGSVFGKTKVYVGDAAHFLSPWWAPPSVKESMHTLVCGESQNQVKLEWIPGNGDENKIVVKSGEHVLLNKKVTSVEVKTDRIVLNRRGRMETVSSLW